jgi:hypothetical protein
MPPTEKHLRNPLRIIRISRLSDHLTVKIHNSIRPDYQLIGEPARNVLSLCQSKSYGIFNRLNTFAAVG